MNDETPSDQARELLAVAYERDDLPGVAVWLRTKARVQNTDFGIILSAIDAALATKPIGDGEREAIRREALEEAARVAEGSLWFENRNNIARAIRALSPDDPLLVLKVKQLGEGDL